MLAFQSGLRVGELSALKKADISGNRRSIHVQRTEITYKDPVTNKRVCEVSDFPKTDAGERFLILPDQAADTINAILALNPEDEYLFSEAGKRIRANAFNRRLSRVCDELNILHRSMHKIRKTYGTTLIDANVQESFVTEQMGHTTIETTKKYYYYCNKDDAAKINQINRAVSC